MFALINLSYLAAAVCFILGIKGMTRPKTAVRGNQLAAIGMLIAVVAALLHQEIISYAAIIAGMLLGGSIGVWLADGPQPRKCRNWWRAWALSGGLRCGGRQYLDACG